MSKSTSDDTSQSSPKKRTRRNRLSLSGIAIIVAVVLALAAVAGSAYVWKRENALAKQAQQVPALKQTIAAQQTTLNNLHQQLNSVSGAMVTKSQFQSRVSQLHRQTKGELTTIGARVDNVATNTRSAIAHLQKVIGARRMGAHIADAGYLLHIARNQANIRHDPAAMQAALTGAQHALAGVQDSAARVLRRQIEAALSELKTIPAHPQSHVAHQLVTLAAKVSQLPLKTQRLDTQASQPSSKPEHWWQRIGPSLARVFGQLVTIRHIDYDVQPLLPPQQRWFLYHNVSLELDAARVAALQGNAAAYRAAIERASTWLKQYFDTQDAAVQSTLKTLTQLHDAQLQPKLPDLSAAFDTLRQLRTLAGAGSTS